jgi:tetratricopeptide (TPR) repeat protein
MTPRAEDALPPRWRLGLLPVRVDTGRPAHDWLQNGLVTLAQQALEGHSRIDLVPTLAALPAGTEALPAADQARRAAHGLGLDGVVQASVREQGAHLWLDWQCLRNGRPVQAGSLREVAPTALGERLARALAEALLPEGPHDVRPVSDDAFVNQAYARGMELLLQEDYAAALPLLQLVCELSPDNLAAALARVRCLGPIGHPSATAEALALMPRALASGDTRLQARVHVALFVSRMRSRPQEARQDDAAVMSLAARAEHAHWWREDWLLRHLANRGMLALFRRQSAEGADLLGQAAAACRAAGHRVLLAAVQRTAAMAHLALGQVDLASGDLDEAAEVYRQAPQTVALLHLGANRVLVDLARGEFDAACTHADAFCEALAQSGTPMLPVGTTGSAALAYFEAGRQDALARLLLLLEERPEGLEHRPRARACSHAAHCPCWRATPTRPGCRCARRWTCAAACRGAWTLAPGPPCCYSWTAGWVTKTPPSPMSSACGPCSMPTPAVS